jgi:hypothetical protein
MLDAFYLNTEGEAFYSDTQEAILELRSLIREEKNHSLIKQEE